MGLETTHMAAVAELALVGAYHLHVRGLPDNHRRRFDRTVAKRVDEAAHADAADFLIMGKSEVQGRHDVSCQEFRRQRQAHADEALHIAGSAAIEASVVLDHLKRIRVPVLSIHRNHVRVTGERDARPIGGAEGRV